MKLILNCRILVALLIYINIIYTFIDVAAYCFTTCITLIHNTSKSFTELLT